MNHTFQTEEQRHALELMYVKDYRFSQPRSSMLNMHSDITASEDDLADYNPRLTDLTAKYDHLENPEWLRRCAIGYFEKKTGRDIFTFPKQDRWEKIMTYLQSKDVLSPVVLLDHNLSITDANEYAAINRYNQFADQPLLCGTFRGWFYGFSRKSTRLIQTVLMIHQVKGEGVFRIRRIQTYYDNSNFQDEQEMLVRVQKNDWNDCKISDGFASFGTEFGRGFLMSDESTDFGMDNFKFNKVGRRVISMEAIINDVKTRLTLPKRPEGIDFVIRLLNSIKI